MTYRWATKNKFKSKYRRIFLDSANDNTIPVLLRFVPFVYFLHRLLISGLTLLLT